MSKSTKELVAELRSRNPWTSRRNLCELAADQLEALADEVERQREELLKAELTAALAQERERTKWLPLLEATEVALRALDSKQPKKYGLPADELEKRIRAAREALK